MEYPQSLSVDWPPAASRPENKLFVGNLPNNITEEHIQRLFAKYSPKQVKKLQMGMKCFAFVHVTDAENALKAIRDLNSSTYEGRCLIVRVAKRHSSTDDNARKVDEHEVDACCEGTATESESSDDTADSRTLPGHKQQGFTWTKHRLYVGNLPNDITKDRIQQLFAKYSPRRLERVQMGMKCFAFLDVGNAKNVSLAIRELDKTAYEGRRLIVSEMKSKTVTGDRALAPKEDKDEESSFESDYKEECIRGPSPSHGTDYAGNRDELPRSGACMQCRSVLESQCQEEVCMRAILVQQSRNLQLEEKKLLLEIEKLQLEIKKLTRENSFFTCRA